MTGFVETRWIRVQFIRICMQKGSMISLEGGNINSHETDMDTWWSRSMNNVGLMYNFNMAETRLFSTVFPLRPYGSN